jgi:hypothetical protein
VNPFKLSVIDCTTAENSMFYISQSWFTLVPNGMTGHPDTGASYDDLIGAVAIFEMLPAKGYIHARGC